MYACCVRRHVEEERVCKEEGGGGGYSGGSLFRSSKLHSPLVLCRAVCIWGTSGEAKYLGE